MPFPGWIIKRFCDKGSDDNTGRRLQLFDWEDSKRFVFPDNLDTLDSADQQKYKDLKAQAEKENQSNGRIMEQSGKRNRAVLFTKTCRFADRGMLGGI